MTNGDVERIADAVCKKLEANSLGDLKQDIAGLRTDVAMILVIEGEVRQINQRLSSIE